MQGSFIVTNFFPFTLNKFTLSVYTIFYYEMKQKSAYIFDVLKKEENETNFFSPASNYSRFLYLFFCSHIQEAVSSDKKNFRFFFRIVITFHRMNEMNTLFMFYFNHFHSLLKTTYMVHCTVLLFISFFMLYRSTSHHLSRHRIVTSMSIAYK